MFSDALKHHRKSLNLSQKKLAELLNVSQSTIAMWECGKNTPEYSSLIKLATIFNTSLDSLIGKSSNVAIKSIPVFKDTYDIFQRNDSQGVLYYENIIVASIDYNNYFGLIVQDDLMAPRMVKGDLLIIKQCQNFRPGDICVIQTNCNNITVKKVVKNDFGIILISFNNIYEPQFYSNEDIKKLNLSIIGKVVELRAKL